MNWTRRDTWHLLAMTAIFSLPWLLPCLLFGADLGTGSPPALKAAVKPATKAADLHSHRCQRCGTTWEHTHESKGKVADHTCPKCGTLVWEKYTAAPRARVIVGWRTVCHGTYCTREPIYADAQ